MRARGESCPCGAQAVRVVEDFQPHSGTGFTIVECDRCGLRLPLDDRSEREILEYYHGYGHYADPDYQAAEMARRKGGAKRLMHKLARRGGADILCGRFLEVGCASAAFLANVAQISSFECYGVEVDPASATQAEARLPGRIFNGPLAAANYPSGWFSVVYLEQVVEHVPDTQGLLTEIRRILCADGIAILGTPNFAGLAAILLRSRWKEFIPRDHIRMFSPRSLGYHLKLAGFRRHEIATQGSWLIRRADGRDLLPLRREGIPARLVGRCLGVLRMGDLLMATAWK